MVHVYSVTVTGRLVPNKVSRSISLESFLLRLWMTQHILRYCEPGAVFPDDGRTEGNMK